MIHLQFNLLLKPVTLPQQIVTSNLTNQRKFIDSLLPPIPIFTPSIMCDWVSTELW